MPLTDSAIRNAKPGIKPTGEATRNPYKLADSGGMYLEVYPNGSKYWRLKYRYAGKEKRLALGVYPDVTLKEARNRRDAARKLLADGTDPGQAKQAEKRERKLSAANSFESVAREWYGKQVHTWVKTHAADVLRRLEGNAFPVIGHRPIKEIEPPELLMMARKIESRGAHDLAHRVLQVCGQVFRYGVATGRCTRDPVPDLRGALTPHVKKNQAAIKPEELPDLMRAIDSYDQTGDKQTKLALKLLALTFVRTNELIGAEWVEFDLDSALWVIPAGRMKMKNEHVVPLCGQAQAILRELQPMAGGSRFVFPGRNRDKPISNNTMLFALYRLGYKGKMTGHGFRAVASTSLNEMGFRPDVIERQLAHCERNEVRGAYNRAEYLQERRGMMQHWGDYLDAIATGAKILPFQRVA
ncbi:MAG: integrase arm-type DNA-binding domain-containing protein [Rhizobium sp.]|nr:integrase arm-type DNA-binding domain-containing protein [Rhizobium sp.]